MPPRARRSPRRSGDRYARRRHDGCRRSACARERDPGCCREPRRTPRRNRSIGPSPLDQVAQKAVGMPPDPSSTSNPSRRRRSTYQAADLYSRQAGSCRSQTVACQPESDLTMGIDPVECRALGVRNVHGFLPGSGHRVPPPSRSGLSATRGPEVVPDPHPEIAETGLEGLELWRAENPVGAARGDHLGRRVEIAADHARHDRGVDDAQGLRCRGP